MQRPTHLGRPVGRKGFTLIELLVVIAIIAILAAILFPVFARAREKARQTSCASNEKQMGLAFMQYTQDYDDHPPNGISQIQGQCNHSGGGWAGQIYPYAKSTGIFTCPDDPMKAPTNRTVISYSYNTGQNATTQSSCNQGSASPPVDAVATMYSIAKYNASSKTILLTEFRMPNLTGAAITVPELNGSAGGNVYISPTEVPGQSIRECVSAANCQGNGGGINYYSGVVTGWIGNYRTGANYYFTQDFGSTIPNADYTGVHSGGSNFLFFDGHVKWLQGSQISAGGNNATAGDCGNGSNIGANTGCGTVAGTYSIL